MKFKVFKFKTVKSTNDTAINMIKRLNLNYGMIISESQRRGKGQYGRKWISFKGNLFVSLFYNIENLNFTLERLTKINCLLVKKLISKYYKKKIFYKRPNDLLINKKKICGILQETIDKLNKKYLIVGIGINLIKNPILKNYKTTNLSELTNRHISKKKIEYDLKKIFENKLSKLYRMNK